MKIGILTFHRALNYGAVLQCYSLSEFLRAMGHDVEVIDYRPAYIERHRNLFYWKGFKKKSLIEKLKVFFFLPQTYVNKKKAAQAFDTFLYEHLKFSVPVYAGKDIPSYYDVIVLGSDQIWSPSICEGFDSIYYGQAIKNKAKLVSYAASLEGFRDFMPQQWNYIIHQMENFEAISVREEVFRDELTKRTGKNVECVLDPTLLVSSSFFDHIGNSPLQTKYVLLFTVQQGKLPYNVAQKIASKLDCIVVRVSALPTQSIFKKERHVRQIVGCTPNEFVGLIKNAECVVTNSFHATAISLQMQREFYSVQCPKATRIKNVLKLVNLEDRFVDSLQDIDNAKKIDYKEVGKRLTSKTIASRIFIETAIRSGSEF